MLTSRFRRITALAGCCLAAAIALPSAAGAAQRLESFPVPSLKGNVDVKSVRLNKVSTLRATVMLPDGYDEDASKSWPVVYMLQGIGDNSEAWAAPGTGNIAKLAAGLPAIVVMPEGGRGFFLDWWRGGARNGPNWQQYILDEVVPLIETRYRIKPGRQYHAMAGASMGGYGALLLGGQLPGYFGTAVSMSGLVDDQSQDTQLLIPYGIGTNYERVWGRVNGQYAEANNPIATPQNLGDTRVYLSSGNGKANWNLPFSLNSVLVGGPLEEATLKQNERYDRALTRAGVEHTRVVRGGVHDWPYWRRELPRAIEWGFFNAPPVAEADAAKHWTYKTMAPHGNAWGIGYTFAAPTTKIMTLQRDGQTLAATGAGTVTIAPGAAPANASGAGTQPACTFTTTLPFTHELPAGC
jgi:S-formylglutathione hydrolase FrmB